MVSDAIETHQSLCSQIKGFKLTFDNLDGQLKFPNEVSYLPENWPQRDHYRLLPVFRALIIILDHKIVDPLSDTDPTVKIVLTGMTDGLSAPITFDRLLRKRKGTYHIDPSIKGTGCFLIHQSSASFKPL
jgi:hypothetical protein